MSLSNKEMELLRKACDKLDDGPDYRCDHYVDNLINTVLDFQMKVETVDSAMKYFKNNHRVNSHRGLKALLSKYPNTKKGNTDLANFLWNNNHWSRSKFLRLLMDRFEKKGVKGQKSLERWVKNADFKKDVQGQFKTEEHSIGYTLFHWIRLRCGVDTVKPDVHILNFVSDVIGRKVAAKETVSALKRIAKESKRKAHRLDAAIWHYQRE